MNDAKVDFTKTRSYAYTDLALKGVAAIAAVVLGAAGYQLQSSVTSATKEKASLEEEAREALPSLRALAELEVATNLLSTPPVPPRDPQDAAILGSASAHLRAVAGTLLVLDPDTPTTLSLPMLQGALHAYQEHQIGVRNSAIALADICELGSLIRHSVPAENLSDWRAETTTMPNLRPPVSMMLVRPREGLGVFPSAKGSTDTPRGGFSLVVQPETIRFWEAWAGPLEKNTTISVDTVLELLPAAARAVQRQALSASARILANHKLISADYVALRAQTFQARISTRPSTEPRGTPTP